MNIRLKENVFIRHIGDESMLVAPRTGGCTILTHARLFIDQLSGEWKSLDEIIGSLVIKLQVGVEAVRADALLLYDELLSQGFAELSSDNPRVLSELVVNTIESPESVDDDSMPLSDFYRRHGMLPLELHIDLTDACTEHCVHCYVPQRQNHFLSLDLIQKAVIEFREMQGLSVHLTGGEAMLHPNFREACRLCKSLNLNILIFSNLTRCDDRMVQFLKEVDPQFVNVSLYAMDPNIHDGITKLPGSWNRTMDAIKRCEQAGVHIRIAAPLLRANKDEFGKLLSFTEEHNMHLIPNFDIVPRSNHDCSNLDYACSGVELYETLLRYKSLFDEGYGPKKRVSEGKVCSIGTLRLYLNAQGHYYPCDSMHEYVLGDVRTHTLSEIWQSEALNRLRTLREMDFPKCHSCERRDYCKVCPAFNFNAIGDLFAVCPEKCAVTQIVHRVYGES